MKISLWSVKSQVNVNYSNKWQPCCCILGIPLSRNRHSSVQEQRHRLQNPRISLSARAKADDDEMAASFSFLALDEEDEAARQRRALRKKPSSTEPTPEGQVKMFVWGLNDKDQLGV